MRSLKARLVLYYHSIKKLSGERETTRTFIVHDMENRELMLFNERSDSFPKEDRNRKNFRLILC